MSEFKLPEPSAFIAGDQYGNVGLSTKENVALRSCEAGSTAEPLYTADALRDVLEQAALVCDSRHHATTDGAAACIRKLKESIQ